ncbi:MAG: deoxyuridine 5'-triphosphate nucleotidohydrolase [Halobacteriaceae archaeon]
MIRIKFLFICFNPVAVCHRGTSTAVTRYGFESRRRPRPMFESGAYVAEHVEPTADEQVQPNGVDLTLDAVFEQVGAGYVGRDGKTVGERRELDSAGTYELDPGGYVVRYAETVHIPGGHVGFLYPRSTLLRNSCMLDTAVWDAGYEGRGEGLLEVYHPVDIEPGARIAQLVLAAADHEEGYAGSYQGENL